MRRVAVVLLVLLAAAACGTGAGPGSETASGATHRLDVVAGAYPLAEAARRVGGAAVAVADLTPAGGEPHHLELTPAQVDRIAAADVVLYLGDGFQPAVEETAERLARRAVDLLDELPAGAGARRDDPHVWLDPVLMAAVVDAVEAALAGADPAAGEGFAERAAAYRRDLAALHEEFRAGLAGCQRRVLVTTHAAFGHLAGRYGLRQEAVAGVSPEGEPNPARLAAVVDLVRETGSTTVFTEPLASPRVAETVAREAGVTTAVLHPLEALTEAEAARGDTYVTIMRRNLATLRSALACPG